MTSAGDLIDEALRKAHKACSYLIPMVTKRKLSRADVKQAADDLEEAARLIRTALVETEKRD